MRKGRLILRFATLAMLIAFGFGVVKLWMLRFDPGDIYAPYSSMRSDPLGTRAFYESLDKLPGVKIRRNYRSLKKLKPAETGTLFYLGVNDQWIPNDVDMSATRPADDEKTPVSSAEAIRNFVANGGRLVVSFTPAVVGGVEDFRRLFEEENEDEPETQPETQPKPKSFLHGHSDDDTRGPDEIALGMSVGYNDEATWEQGRGTPAVSADPTSADWTDIPWYGRLYFEKLIGDWKVLYRHNGNAVIIERTIGDGTIVICADSYFLSNEALAKSDARNTPMLAWLAKNRNIIFDETHLGAINAEGIATLAKDHGLSNLFFVLVLLAGLYVWKNTTSVLPRDPEQAERFGGRSIAGKSSAAGLHNLLRSCIPTPSLLNECMKHWSASTTASRPKQKETLQKIHAVIQTENSRSNKRRDPVKAYAKICELLAERKK